MAESVIAGLGVIASEFFDVGCSRRVPWMRRPRAAALLEQAQGAAAVSMRWWSGSSSGRLPIASSMRSPHCWPHNAWRCGCPETGGPVDLADANHRVLMQVLAAQSQREVVRSRHRTLAAMTAQTVEQGRFLGGRPPYGYRLVDAGAHPNLAHAAWGRRRSGWIRIR
ncbi:MAG: hypothetical protein L0K86_19930 [Actinomycetia bacterium]|nr:hypothetical protein [Actinomycetes bacterium]